MWDKVDFYGPIIIYDDMLDILHHKDALTVYQMTNFQTGPNWEHLQLTICSWQKKCDWKMKVCFGKQCGKGVKMFLTAVFSKGFFFKVIKSQDCVGKG